jgi:hypothetical protein
VKEDDDDDDIFGKPVASEIRKVKDQNWDTFSYSSSSASSPLSSCSGDEMS